MEASSSSPVAATSSTATSQPNSFLLSLLSGAVAGVSVDLSLFPIDTVKTRLQAPQGFIAAGGFKGVYRGLGAAAVGSAPGASLFFTVYDSVKSKLLLDGSIARQRNVPESRVHMAAACCGEVAACLVRVPTEVIKSAMQTGRAGCGTVPSTMTLIVKEGGGAMALYKGFGATILREIPFALIQFPIYEHLKVVWRDYEGGSELAAVKGAACGSLGGGLAAALTTPLDVVKTRLMLGKDKAGVEYKGVVSTVSRIVNEEGAKTLLSGIKPRVMWISIGGYIFFFAYETTRNFLSKLV